MIWSTAPACSGVACLTSASSTPKPPDGCGDFFAFGFGGRGISIGNFSLLSTGFRGAAELGIEESRIANASIAAPTHGTRDRPNIASYKNDARRLDDIQRSYRESAR